MDQSRELGSLSRELKWMVAVFQRCACRGIRGVGGCWESKRLSYGGGLHSCLSFFKIPALLLCVSVRVQGLCINFRRGQKGHWGVSRGVRGASRL